MSSLYIFTDGSSRGNPGPGGWGAIVQTDDQVIELGGHEDGTTNNRMELLAVTEACKQSIQICTKAEGASKNTVYIFLDSAYVLNGAQSWLSGWKRNNWVTSTKTPVLNKDLWQAFDETYQELKQLCSGVIWHKVAGHADVTGNERCDVIATSFADKASVNLFCGTLHDYPLVLVSKEGGQVSPTSTVSRRVRKSAHSHETSADRSLKKKKPKGPAYSYVSEIQGIVMTHASWEDCKKRVHGVKAKFQRVESAHEEAEVIAKWRN